MMVGSFGNVTFKVSSKYVRTIEKLEMTESVTYAEHAIHGKAPRMEFTGRNLRTGSFPIILSAFMGISPRKYVAKIRKLMYKHKAVNLILGQKAIGKKWVITDMKETSQYFDADGTILQIEVTVTIKEYR
jgi:phage protein U